MTERDIGMKLTFLEGGEVAAVIEIGDGQGRQLASAVSDWLEDHGVEHELEVRATAPIRGQTH